MTLFGCATREGSILSQNWLYSGCVSKKQCQTTSTNPDGDNFDASKSRSNALSVRNRQSSMTASFAPSSSKSSSAHRTSTSAEKSKADTTSLIRLSSFNLPLCFMGIKSNPDMMTGWWWLEIKIIGNYQIWTKKTQKFSCQQSRRKKQIHEQWAGLQMRWI